MKIDELAQQLAQAAERASSGESAIATKLQESTQVSLASAWRHHAHCA
jgi:hypothetical protein